MGTEGSDIVAHSVPHNSKQPLILGKGLFDVYAPTLIEQRTLGLLSIFSRLL